jgi:hypothetical protein
MVDAVIEAVTGALAPLSTVSALTLGGSRARGAAGPNSDYDFGLYYGPDGPPDIDELAAALSPIVDRPPGCVLTPIGGWGPWINGGGWLKIGGKKVDLLYRDLAKVRAIVDECRAGRVAMDYQPGHPHGFCSAILMGEAALGVGLIDRAGRLAAIKRDALPYPDSLRRALIDKFHWEIAFAIDNAEQAIGRRDATHVAGCAYRALCCLAQVLFAANRRYLINEKGALAEAASLETTIPDLGSAVAQVWSAIGTQDFRRATGSLRDLARALDETIAEAA